MTFDVKFTENQSFNTEFRTSIQSLNTEFTEIQSFDTGLGASTQPLNAELGTPSQPLDAELGTVQIIDSGTVVNPLPQITNVTLLADAWIGTVTPFSQVVVVPGATKHSQVDLTPSAEQLTIFYEKDLAFVTENEDGVVTVYAIGQKPTNDYIIQVTVTEVDA